MRLKGWTIILHLDEIFKNGKGNKTRERPEGYWYEPLIIDSSVSRSVIIRALTVDSRLDWTREREMVRFRSVAGGFSVAQWKSQCIRLFYTSLLLLLLLLLRRRQHRTCKHRHTSPLFFWTCTCLRLGKFHWDGRTSVAVTPQRVN